MKNPAVFDSHWDHCNKTIESLVRMVFGEAIIVLSSVLSLL